MKRRTAEEREAAINISTSIVEAAHGNRSKQLKEIVRLYRAAMLDGRSFYTDGNLVCDSTDSGGGIYAKAVGINPVESAELIVALLNLAEDLANG